MSANAAKTLWSLALVLGFLTFAESAHGSVANPNKYERLRQTASTNIRTRLGPLLERYCSDACQIVDIKVAVDELIPETDDLGFEGVEGRDVEEQFYVEQVSVEIQIDRRITQKSRERLHSILSNHLKNFGSTVQIVWTPVELPQIGQSISEGEIIKRELETKVNSAVDRVIRSYCPTECILSNVIVSGHILNPDDTVAINPTEIFKSKTSNTYYQIENIEVLLSLDASLLEREREKIINIMKANTAFVSPVKFTLSVTPFPESFATKKAKEDAESADPYGLEKLRRMLTLFRDLAGTKEIISSTDSKLSGDSNWIMYVVGLIILAGIIGIVVMRFATAKQDANFMIHAIGTGGDKGKDESGKSGTMGTNGATIKTDTKSVALRAHVQDLKEELINIFVDSPRVAKETFTRMLLDEGVEEIAKYVHLFGKMIIFELLSDPNLHRNLYELSEFYHKSAFTFTPKEEEELLQSLRTRVTANEIRVLTRKTMEQFDFVLRLDASQIHELIRDESAQVQSIVLTQITPRHRRTVFKLFEGPSRIELMKELCKADAIPKEYLANVAKALQKKVLAKPQFDTTNLRSSEILLDLIERSSLEEQRALMRRLVETNPDSARAIKLKLVTLEILPYLKDGQLLELVLGMEREDLLTFLVGTKAHVRDLLLSHAPRELSDSWIEEMESVSTVEESKYRVVEISILNKIRHFASTGAINLLDINEMLFADDRDPAAQRDEAPNIPRQAIVA